MDDTRLWQTLGNIEAKIDALGSLEGRVRVIENWRWYLLGLFSLGTVSGVVGLLVVLQRIG